MEIKKIKKVNGNKYKIELDNAEKIITYDEVILKNNVLFDKEIDNEKLNQINVDNSFYHIYNKVLNYVSKRIRSEKEIREFLKKYELEYFDNEEMIDKLKESNFLNDISFMKAYINDRIYLSNYGPYKIRKELIDHNIDESLIDNELYKINDEVIHNKLQKIITKKISSNKKLSSSLLRQKLMGELINLGYDKEMILTIYGEWSNGNDLTILKKEYETAYKKMSKKYSGKELVFKIKGKMLQKGYSIEEISNIINED